MLPPSSEYSIVAPLSPLTVKVCDVVNVPELTPLINGAVVTGTVVSTVKVGIVSVLLSFPSESVTFIVQPE